MNENPVLLDKVLGQLQTALEANVSWLTHAYGKTQRIVKRIQGRDYYMPAIYTGDTEYLSMLPDARLGNFSFFDIPDAYRFPEYNRFAPNKFFTPFRLVVWFDERTIWGPGMSNREQLKMDVLAVLGQVTLSDGGLWVEKVYERHENIYRGYSLSEVDTQYLMVPYGGFAVEGELELSEECVPAAATDQLYDNQGRALKDSEGQLLWVPQKII